jgi:flagellar assembly protein FliH
MSPRAQRSSLVVDAFDWSRPGVRSPSRERTLAGDPAADVPAEPHHAPDFAALERDAFVKGYAQGERAGAEAAAARSEAMIRRLARTLDELALLRGDMIQKSERQLVHLAIAIARRIIFRELTIDRSLLSAMARVALDRLGESASATIRVHPADHAAITAQGGAHVTAGAVRVTADPLVPRGGCIVQSDFGLIDIGLDAQLTELSVLLLGDETAGLEAPVHASV